MHLYSHRIDHSNSQKINPHMCSSIQSPVNRFSTSTWHTVFIAQPKWIAQTSAGSLRKKNMQN